MKYGMNLLLWADDLHENMLPVIENLKQMGFDRVEIPVFNLDIHKWKQWAARLYHSYLALNKTLRPLFEPCLETV